MWFFFSAASAFFDAGKHILSKQTLSKDKVHPMAAAWALAFFSLPLTLPLAIWNWPIALDQAFWLAASVALTMDFASMLMYAKAIQSSDISLSVPMLAFVPLLLLVSGYVINEEAPTILGVIGVCMIVAGAYFLHFDYRHVHPLQPFFAIFKDQGTALMFGVAIIWGISSALHKRAIVHSNPFFYTGFSAVVLTVALTPLAVLFGRKSLIKAWRNKKIEHLAAIGLFDGAAILMESWAQSMAFSAFVLAIKRTGILLTAVGGAVFFHEKIKDRLLPIGVMLIGVLAIAVSKF